MTSLDHPNPRRNRIVRACRAVCFPPFYVAVFLSLAALGFLVAWIIVDASFAETLIVAEVDVGWFISPIAPISVFEPENRWNALGSRLALLALVIAVGLLGTAIALLRLAVGRGPGRSLRGLMISVAMLGAWFALFAGYDRLAWRGMFYQLDRDISRFEIVATELTKHWTEGGEVDGIGEFDRPDSDSPDIQTFLRGDSLCTWRLPRLLHCCISRQPDGSLTFNWLRPCLCVQFRPANNEPVDWREKFSGSTSVRMRIKEVWKLKDHWFLVRCSLPEFEEMVQQPAVPPPAAPVTNNTPPNP